MNVNKARFAINAHTQAVINYISQEENITKDDAFRKLMKTKTYALLLDIESHLYSKSRAYVLDMYQSELVGDWDNWVTV